MSSLRGISIAGVQNKTVVDYVHCLVLLRDSVYMPGDATSRRAWLWHTHLECECEGRNLRAITYSCVTIRAIVPIRLSAHVGANMELLCGYPPG